MIVTAIADGRDEVGGFDRTDHTATVDAVVDVAGMAVMVTEAGQDDNSAAIAAPDSAAAAASAAGSGAAAAGGGGGAGAGAAVSLPAPDDAAGGDAATADAVAVRAGRCSH